MNKQTNRSTRTLLRALLTASAGVIIALSQVNCTGLGLGKDKDRDDSAIASDDEPSKKRKGSLFNRAKDRNSYIDDEIQTTRRDRLAAQNANYDFDLQPYPTDGGRQPAYDAAAMTDTLPNAAAAPGPLTPRSDLELDPDPAYTRAQPPSRNARPEDSLSLPSLDSDFPQPNQPAAEPYRNPTPRRVASDDGYIPLQPKLPSQETIVPPSE